VFTGSLTRVCPLSVLLGLANQFQNVLQQILTWWLYNSLILNPIHSRQTQSERAINVFHSMYRELEHTVYFVTNDYHRFPNFFIHFYGNPQHTVVTSFAIKTNCILMNCGKLPLPLQKSINFSSNYTTKRSSLVLISNFQLSVLVMCNNIDSVIIVSQRSIIVIR